MIPSRPPADRRVSNRAPIELKVEYKRINTFFADYTKNISKGGTFIRTDKPLEVGTEFIFALAVPGVPSPLRLLGKVQWVVRPGVNAGEGPPGMGIEFLYQSDDDRRAVANSVEELMVRELGEGLTARLLGRHDAETPPTSRRPPRLPE
jgi:type IV pilus assembly protein PilZ